MALLNMSDLREALRAASAAQASGGMHAQPLPQHDQHMHMSHSQSPQNNIDPAIAGPSYAQLSGGDDGDEDMGDGKKGAGGKRELSTSKRAAQNRAAQVRLLVFLFPFP